MTESVTYYIFSPPTKLRPGMEQILRHVVLQATGLTLC